LHSICDGLRHVLLANDRAQAGRAKGVRHQTEP
jgi:hypothetical protein